MATANLTDKKLDILIEKMDAQNEISRDTLSEIKRMGEVQELKIAFHDKEIAALKEKQERDSEARKGIYERLEAQERTCAGYHGLCAQRKDDDRPFDTKMTVWLHGKVGERVLWAVGILGTFLLTKWADKIF